MAKDLSGVHKFIKKEKYKKRADNSVKFIVLNEDRIDSILHKSALSKFFSVKRDVNFSTRKYFGRTFLTFVPIYEEFGGKRKTNY